MSTSGRRTRTVPGEHVVGEVGVLRRLDDRHPRLHRGDEAQQRATVVGLGKTLALQQPSPLELGVGVEEAVGRHERDPRRVRPAAHELLEDARGRRLADGHRPGDPHDERHAGRSLAEELARREAQPVGGLDVEVQQPRQGQVDLLDLGEVEPLARGHAAGRGRPAPGSSGGSRAGATTPGGRARRRASAACVAPAWRSRAPLLRMRRLTGQPGPVRAGGRAEHGVDGLHRDGPSAGRALGWPACAESSATSAGPWTTRPSRS